MTKQERWRGSGRDREGVAEISIAGNAALSEAKVQIDLLKVGRRFSVRLYEYNR